MISMCLSWYLVQEELAGRNPGLVALVVFYIMLG